MENHNIHCFVTYDLASDIKEAVELMPKGIVAVIGEKFGWRGFFNLMELKTYYKLNKDEEYWENLEGNLKSLS